MKGGGLRRRQLEEANVFGNFFFSFFFVDDGRTLCWACDDRGRRERWKKIKVEGVDDSVTTWLMSRCLEQGGGRGGGVVVVVVVVVGVKMLRWS